MKRKKRNNDVISKKKPKRVTVLQREDCMTCADGVVNPIAGKNWEKSIKKKSGTTFALRKCTWRPK